MADSLVADPNKGRSPCFTCPIHLKGISKRSHSPCAQCDKRIQYVREHCAPRTIDEIIRLQERAREHGGIRKVLQGAGDKESQSG